MKKVFMLLAILLNSLLVSAQYSGSGNGTENDPYLIYNETQLYQMSNYLNQDGVVFKLMKDLDLTSFIADNSPSEGWTPVGVESSAFKGKFYGNGHTISGLYINKGSINNVGFFGYIENATIQDLTLRGSSVRGASYTGALCGRAVGSMIYNCDIVLSSSFGASKYVGGVIGYAVNTTVQECSFHSTSLTSNSYSGGNSSSCGGFCGYSQSSAFQSCTCIGNLIEGSDKLGGFVGETTSTNFVVCISSGNVKGGTNIGGFVGFADADCIFNTCKSTGNVYGTRYVSGFVANIMSGSSITFDDCHHKGTIVNAGEYTGGIVGISNGACISTMDNCSHFGDITGENYVGGLIGAITGSIEARPVYYCSSSSYTNEKSLGPSYSSVINGGVTSHLINNSTSIGNIVGETNIGGLIGSDKMSVVYTLSTSGASDTSGTIGGARRWYLWRNNNKISDLNQYYSPEDKKYTVYTTFSNSYYSGIINGTSNVGGIAGYKEGGKVQYCYTNSSIYGSKNVGGIVGNTYGHEAESTTQVGYLVLKSNVAINNTISATESNIGRIYGGKENDNITIGALASAEGNRALTTTRVIKKGVVQEVTDDLQNGNVMGKSLLRLKANYVALGWNFDENWDILETECYPYKKFQAAPPVIESNLVSQDTEISGSSLNGGTVYLFYKDREAVSTTCNGNSWTFTTEKLQSGAPVQLYADVEGMTPSYLTSTTVGYPGSGTEEDPYRIYTAEDLQGANNKGYYKLMNDIDLSAWINENSPTNGWLSIGRNSGEATYINGDGHKVTGLWINTTEDYTGLFSNFSAGIIKNLTVEVATGKKVKGGDYTGILIGRNANGQLLNCTVKGDVEGTKHVGGVTGYSGNNDVNAVSFEGSVTSVANDAYVGGFAGLSENDNITAVHTFATISATGVNNYVGGAIGHLNGGILTKSHAENTLTATGSSDYVGGLVGYLDGDLSLSYSTGTVTASGADSYTGGLVGFANNAIANSYSTAKTIGTYYTAGLCAYTYSTIDKCYAKGDVYGSRYGGGVVAQLDGANASLKNSVAANNKLELTDQSSWGSRVIGGFRNGAAEPNSSNYALSTMQVSLNGVAQKKTDDAVEGIAKPESMLMSANTYIGLGWDYSTAWSIDEGQTYPYLLWEIDVNPVTEITFDNSNLIIAQGKTATLAASVMPLGATNKRLEWHSSNNTVATVADGVVTAVGIGTANITATSTDGSNISATCKVTVVANKDAAIAELQNLVDEAQKLYDNSTEGDNIGQYQAGARVALLAAIRSVKERISSTMGEEEIVSCTNDINNAVGEFRAKQISAGEDTDITMYENVLFFDKTEVASGQQVTLSLNMNNIIAPTGFQCDIYFPEGVTVAKDEDDFNLVGLSLQRTTEQKTNYFDSVEQPDGCLRIMCSSTKSYTFAGNEGEVATITVNVAEDMEDGEYPLIIKNIVLSDASANTYEVEYVKTTLTVSSYTLGDANNDTKINVGDFTAIANAIMGNPAATFVEKAADVNEDGKINVGDLTGVANLILYGTVTPSTSAKAHHGNTYLPTVVSVDDCNASADTEFTVAIDVKGSYQFSAYQFDLTLPEGISVKMNGDEPCIWLSTVRTNEKHTNFFASEMIAKNIVRVLAASTNDYTFEGSEGSVAYVTFVADHSVANGDYTVRINNIVLSANGEALTPAEAAFGVHVGNPTGIEDTLSDNTNLTVYDLSGKMVKHVSSVSELKKGVYVVNGNKIVR